MATKTYSNIIINKLKTYFIILFSIFFISCQSPKKQEKADELTWEETPDANNSPTPAKDASKINALTTPENEKTTDNEEGDPPAELDLPAYMVLESQWTMHGTIGSYRVNGTVTFTQDGLHGQYGYDGKKTGITLRGGPVDENDGHLFAQEFNYKGEQCGEYHGIFTYPKTCKGVFTNYKGETFDFVWHFE